MGTGFVLSLAGYGLMLRIMGESGFSPATLRQAIEAVSEAAKTRNYAALPLREQRLGSLSSERKRLFPRVLFVNNLALIALGSTVIANLMNFPESLPPFFQGVLELVFSAAITAIIQLVFYHGR